MKKSEQIKMINRLYVALCGANIGQRGFSDYWRKLVQMNEKAEKEHRSWCGGRHRCGITVKTAARYFSCKYILEHRAGSWKDENGSIHKPYVPKVADILSIRLECFHGYALWKMDRKAICKAVSKKDALQFMREIDYAKLMEVPE